MQYDEQSLQKVREDRFLISHYDSWLFQEMQPFLGQRILEIGCGLGNFTHHLVDRQLVVSIDISANSIAHMRDRYATHSHIHALVADITSPKCLDLAQFELDTAISINVFEHIENDVEAFKHTWQLLQPGGVLLLVVPALDWLYGNMDRAIGHFRRYSKRDLVNKLEIGGFEVQIQKYINAPATIGWLVNGRVLKRKTPPQRQLKLLNPIIPFVQRIERIVSPPFGLSLFTIASRPKGS